MEVIERMTKTKDLETVTRTLAGEARGQGLLDRLGVLAVIRERTFRPGWWGRGWSGVCRHPWQFSCWHPEHDEVHSRNYNSMVFLHETDPALWLQLTALSVYTIDHMTDRDVHALFGVSEFPTHYHDRSIDTPTAWGGNIEEIAVPWDSHFRWYIVYDGRPPRRLIG